MKVKSQTKKSFSSCATDRGFPIPPLQHNVWLRGVRPKVTYISSATPGIFQHQICAFS
ncbi:hypothetical protein HanRHA438_Chr11g0506671 [Helianthus annuus]|nr:hypothetical protein HanIR_Chr11g0531981 [Helianthus annuus]KAJ0870960.1 hypothetical protein HanRHA438_Chr11g0506671 [Helianthus annuus]